MHDDVDPAVALALFGTAVIREAADPLDADPGRQGRAISVLVDGSFEPRKQRVSHALGAVAGKGQVQVVVADRVGRADDLDPPVAVQVDDVGRDRVEDL